MRSLAEPAVEFFRNLLGESWNQVHARQIGSR